MSYSRKDEAVMKRVVKFLRKQGIDVWVDNEKLVPGTPMWEVEIEKAIKGAVAVIVLLSPDSNDSPWVRREISYAEDNWVSIFPILIAGDERNAVPIRLTNHQRIDLRQNEEVGMKSLHTALLSHLEIIGYQESRARVDAAELEARQKAELEVAKKVARHKTEREAVERAAKEKADRELAEETIKEKATDKTTLQPRWRSILWMALCWFVGYTISFWIGYRFDNFLVGGAIGGTFSGIITLVVLLSERVSINRMGMLWITLAGTISLSIGFSFPFAEIYASYELGFTLGGLLGGSLNGLVTALTVQSGRFITNWKNTLWFMLAEAVGLAVGLLTGELLFSSDFSLVYNAFVFGVGGAIGGAIIGSFVITSIRKQNS
jgi:hypothetical protein